MLNKSLVIGLDTDYKVDTAGLPEESHYGPSVSGKGWQDLLGAETDKRNHPTSGTGVTISHTAPSSHRYEISIVEINAAS
jgi:hypothetical protein